MLLEPFAILAMLFRCCSNNTGKSIKFDVKVNRWIASFMLFNNTCYIFKLWNSCLRCKKSPETTFHWRSRGDEGAVKRWDRGKFRTVQKVRRNFVQRRPWIHCVIQYENRKTIIQRYIYSARVGGGTGGGSIVHALTRERHMKFNQVGHCVCFQ